MDVRATSPKVPMCGRPEGPYPVSNSTKPFSGVLSPSRFNRLRASAKGQALAFWAWSLRPVMDVVLSGGRELPSAGNYGGHGTPSTGLCED